MSAWGDFLKARNRLIHEWNSGGIPGYTLGKPTPEEICSALNHHEPNQIRLLLATPLQEDPEPTLEELTFKATMRAVSTYRNHTHASKALGIGRTTLYRRLDRYRKEGKIT